MTTRPKPAIERPLHQALQVFDLHQTAAQLRSEPAWNTGRNAITLRKAAGLQIVLLAMQAGNRLDEHHAAAPIMLHLLSGTVRFATPDQVVDLGPGTALALDGGIAHSVEALEEALCLLTLASVNIPDAPRPHATTTISDTAAAQHDARPDDVLAALRADVTEAEQ